MHNPPLVLIADDESDFREIISAKLTKSGYWVAQAKDGKEAVEKAQMLNPDLIVMDISMPNENGTEAVLDIKNNESTKNVRILFLSSMKTPWPAITRDRPAFAKELGAVDFIDKGGDLDQAVAKIQAALAH